MGKKWTVGRVFVGVVSDVVMGSRVRSSGGRVELVF